MAVSGKKLVSLGGVVLSGVLLVLFLRGYKLQEMARDLKAFHVAYLAPAVFVYLSSFLARAVRWQILLKPLKAISWPVSFSVLMISWMANNLLPARMGELVRAFIIGRREGISASGSFATVVLERVLDGIVLVAFLAGCLVVSDFSKAPSGALNPKMVGLLAGGVFLAAFASLFLLFVQESLALRIAGWFLKPLPAGLAGRIRDLLQSFVSGLACLRSGGAFVAVMGLSVLVWLCEAGTLFLLLKGFEIQVPWSASLFVLSILNLGILIPAAPGYVGSFEFFGAASLALYGVGETVAKSFAISAHAVQFIPVTVMGLIFLSREGLRLGTLMRGSQETGKRD